MLRSQLGRHNLCVSLNAKVWFIDECGGKLGLVGSVAKKQEANRSWEF